MEWTHLESLSNKAINKKVSTLSSLAFFIVLWQIRLHVHFILCVMLPIKTVIHTRLRSTHSIHRIFLKSELNVKAVKIEVAVSIAGY